MKYSETVPKIVIRCIGDIVYDSYISEKLVSLKSAIKPKKQTRFAGEPVTSAKTSEAICQWCALEKATSLKRPSQHYHLTISKLKGVTAPLQIALLISGVIHPPKVKYSLITITIVQ